MPRLPERRPNLDPHLNMYGTTLRVWDPSIQAWQITWTNPAGDHHERQIGRRVGNDVVQIGARANGTPTRWIFSEITGDSFHWTGESLTGDGKTWMLEASSARSASRDERVLLASSQHAERIEIGGAARGGQTRGRADGQKQ
jgi:hypothetical protein